MEWYEILVLVIGGLGFIGLCVWVEKWLVKGDKEAYKWEEKMKEDNRGREERKRRTIENLRTGNISDREIRLELRKINRETERIKKFDEEVAQGDILRILQATGGKAMNTDLDFALDFTEAEIYEIKDILELRIEETERGEREEKEALKRTGEAQEHQVKMSAEERIAQENIQNLARLRRLKTSLQDAAREREAALESIDQEKHPELWLSVKHAYDNYMNELMNEDGR